MNKEADVIWKRNMHHTPNFYCLTMWDSHVGYLWCLKSKDQLTIRYNYHSGIHLDQFSELFLQKSTHYLSLVSLHRWL